MNTTQSMIHSFLKLDTLKLLLDEYETRYTFTLSCMNEIYKQELSDISEASFTQIYDNFFCVYHELEGYWDNYNIYQTASTSER